MDTSCDDIIDTTDTDLQTLVVASVGEKNDTHEVFLLESIDNEINREFCEEILEILNQIQKVNFYGNRTCLSIP